MLCNASFIKIKVMYPIILHIKEIPGTIEYIQAPEWYLHLHIPKRKCPTAAPLKRRREAVGFFHAAFIGAGDIHASPAATAVFFCAADSINLIRLSWLTSLAPGS